MDQDLFNLSIQGNYPKINFDSSRGVDYYDKFRIVLKNETASNIFWFVWYKDGQKNQVRFTPGTNESDFHSYIINLSSKSTWSGTIESFNIEVANKVGTGTVVIDTIELMLKDGVDEHTLSVEAEGAGLVSPAYGTAYTGQNVQFIATPNAGWEFIGWTGDVSSTDNPLNITITNNTTLNAIFEEQVNAIDDVATHSLKVYPNPSRSGIFNLNSHQKWEVYNLSGIKLLTGEGADVNLAMFSKGIYFLKAENGITFKLSY